MRRGRTSPALWLLVSLLSAWTAPARSLHLIGCLYEGLCEDSERCYNDGAFGRCVPEFTDLEQLSRVELSQDDLADLVTVLETLVAQGHHWSHIYTQCVLQTRLLTLQSGEPHDDSACELVNGRAAGWQTRPLPGSHAVPAINIDSEQQYPSPQAASNAEARALFDQPRDDRPEDAYMPATYRLFDEPEVRQYDRPTPIEESWLRQDEEQLKGGGEPRLSREPPSSSAGFMKRAPSYTKLWKQQQRELASEQRSSEVALKTLVELIDDLEKLAEMQEVQEIARNDEEEREGIPQLWEVSHWEQKRERESPLAALERQEAAGRLREQALQQALADDEPALVVDYDALPLEEFATYYDAAPIPLSVRSDPEFQRAERLDIKKPGPWFGVNNYAFDYDSDGKSPSIEEFEELERLPIEPMDSVSSESDHGSEGEDRTGLTLAVDNESRRVDQLATSGSESTASKQVDTPTSTPTAPPPVTRVEDAKDDADRDKKSVGDKYTRYPDPRDAIDSSYVFVRVKDAFQRWRNGKQLVERIEESLALPRDTFDNIRVKGDLVTFHVNENHLGYNSSVVATKIRDLRSGLENQLGVVMVETGQGDGSDGSPGSVILEKDQNTLLVQTLSIVLGVLAASVLLVVVVVFVLRRAAASSRDKLKSLSNPDAEASKDYQELCRSRMAARVSEKDQPEKPQRVHSLSKESDGTASPTSRSSTSSWSEEPVVSNMDISTGHMVLSYMEDHLKRKDKLEEEWRSLCAYEAEPSARTVAALPENENKNRVPSVTPYDHARVTLNGVTNATGGSYINASSITDHDPRNPAYIATQGPLPHTANDFWQMVWEQGSVVIVMLTRLTESGVSMCHRYWPEEGSELYHIYEVHLVSEHIWCDEYLVRSFYLKNLKTTETRTVTQFHFLAWPENGVPTSTKALLEFRRKVNKSYRGRSCPVIVHCSDGAGRTGTYCLIDMVLNRMSKGAKEIDIAASLEHIRDQRVTMVRTRQQFEFVLMAVAEEVHAILKALPQ